jgi:hypothetical protein
VVLRWRSTLGRVALKRGEPEQTPNSPFVVDRHKLAAMSDDSSECPACGGSGGGPFGRPGSAWDREDYECPRCQGSGLVLRAAATGQARPLAKGAVHATDRVAATPGPVKARSTVRPRSGIKTGHNR